MLKKWSNDLPLRVLHAEMSHDEKNHSLVVMYIYTYMKLIPDT